MQVYDALARALYDNDIRTVFGVLGDANLFILNSFNAMADAEYVGAASEGGAVLSAIGYGQVSGKLAVAAVTHGPGLTNTLTALVEAERARQPLLLIAGDSPLSQHEHIQDIDQRSVALTAGAAFERVRSAESAVADVAAAVRRAWVERIPVILNVPIEIQWQDVEYSPVRATLVTNAPTAPAEELVEDAVGLIASSSRPLVLAGRGVALAGSTSAIKDFAARIGAPLATTLRGKDQFRGLPHNLGIFGTLSDDAALDVITQSDCIVAFGCGLNQWTAAEGSLLSGKRIVHVDNDPSRLNLSNSVDVALLGDGALAAEAITLLLDEAEIPASNFVDTATAIVTARRGGDRPTSSSGNFDTAAVLARVDAAVPKNRVVVTDNGRFIHHAFKDLHVEDPLSYAHAVSFGAIGCGMSVAFGATYAAPDRPVLVAVGDGGFALGGLSDLVMAAQLNRNIVVLLLNDFAYGAEYVQLTGRDMKPDFTTLTWPDFGVIAKAIGAQGYTASNFVELDEALASIDFENGPTLLEVRIDPAKA
ncbi:thiamine pyrophosphate-binding protein [Rhodococcus globerulus]|uniref:acetolactate synthase n=1 Tax=Rhodococcus globerulus TaxID=33008 RepID=A0ABU4C4L0_RHOGO|nr:thiamine pyrophosphate-binding protein [Rhodococcus globerulus]MDV6271453.1 thiamine pyrophosphate-binding protein [Rhodococcus globerulus]